LKGLKVCVWYTHLSTVAFMNTNKLGECSLFHTLGKGISFSNVQ